MKRSNFQVWLISLASTIFLFQSCRDNEEVFTVPLEVREINDFIWQNMDTYYFWRDQLPREIDRNLEADSKAYFNKLLNKPEDIWSFITDDVQSLTNSLKGIELTFGHHFKLFRLTNTNKVFGVVRYVIPDSPASRAEMNRGDLFFKVNGNELDTTNYKSLLFGPTSYTLTYGEIENSTINEIDREVNLTAEIVQENPVHLDTVFEVEGKKIGYIAYNQFIPEFESNLQQVFADFKSQNIGDLVLDLRYNPGGSTNTAQKVADMIAPQSVVSAQSTFIQYMWNDILTDYLIDKEGPNSTNLISKFSISQENLNLDRVFILITSSTASASELIINGLGPHMEVILIGSDPTSGKYTGSITLHDQDEKHSWGIQPIVLKSANSLGVTDFKDGFAPDFLVEDDFTAPLGTLDEDMLLQAVALITGIPGPARIAPSFYSTRSTGIGAGDNHQIEHRQKMYLEMK